MRSPLRLLFICGAIVLCSGENSINHLYAADRQDAAPAPSSYEIQYVLANSEFTLLHELAHALFAEFEIPVLGNEEVAADKFASMVFLTSQDSGSGISLEKANMVAIELGIDAVDDSMANRDLHPLAIQRFDDFMCLAYGGDPGNHRDYVKNNWLPPERAVHCRTEYEQASKAILWIYRQYGRPEGNPFDSRMRLLHPPPPVDAQEKGVDRDSQQMADGKISVSYDFIGTPIGEYLLEELKASNLADNLAEQVARNFPLPRDLVISFRNYDEGAYWNARSGTIVISYRLLENYYKHAKNAEKMKSLSGETFPPNLPSAFFQPFLNMHPL